MTWRNNRFTFAIAIEAGLVSGLGKLVMDAQDGLALGDHQAGQVLGEVAALGLVGEEIAVLFQGVLDELGELNNPWHDHMLRIPSAPEQIAGETGLFSLF